MADVAQAMEYSVPSTSPQECWSFLRRFLFRFAFVYLVFYCWPYAGRSNLFDAIPNFGAGAMNDDDTLGLTKIAEAPWRALCPWVAVHVFRLHGEVTQYHVTGSGDTTLDYVQVFCFAVLAAFAAVLWSLLDRRRPSYLTLYAWLRLLVRFTLAFTMLSYGFAKVYPLQFAPPYLSQLTETYGEASPMGILWTFMGASTAYTRFCGIVEVTGGLLLLFKRTTVIGALVAFGAMLNVAVLNFCYDVPVKLYSVHLVLMSLFLLIPDAAALARFFLLRQPSRLEGLWLPPFHNRRLRRGAIALQALAIASDLYNNVCGGYQNLKQYSATLAKHSPLYGVWNVDQFSMDGSPAGAANWRQLVAEFPGWINLRDTNGGQTSYRATYDAPKHAVKLDAPRTKQSGEFTYEQPDPRRLILRGRLNGKQTIAAFHRMDASQFLLTSRGFHWISEYPFNR